MGTTLRNLELMDYADKVYRFGQEQPLKSGDKLSNKVKFEVEQVLTDGLGNLTQMPPLLRKPCFGIPTAYLRHSFAAPKYVHRMKKWVHNGRCDRCQISKSCEKVSRERLSYLCQQNSEFRLLFDLWRNSGGLEEAGFAKAFVKLRQRHWTRMVHLLSLCYFESINDVQVTEYWKKEDASKKAIRDRIQLKERKLLWLEGEDLRGLLNCLQEPTKFRARLLYAASRDDAGPKYIKGIAQSSILMTCRVWCGLQLAKYTGKKENPSSIARCMLNCTDIDSWSHNVLRSRVKTDMVRIRRLESNAKYNNGHAVWPKFKISL